jgi:hypothetical protein
MVTLSEVDALVRSELGRVEDPSLRRRIEGLLVEPYPVLRDWDYGRKDERYTCWTVLEHRRSNTGLAYCEFGFGPRCPWGLVSLSGEHMNIGMDCAWYTTLEDAFLQSCAADGSAG